MTSVVVRDFLVVLAAAFPAGLRAFDDMHRRSTESAEDIGRVRPLFRDDAVELVLQTRTAGASFIPPAKVLQ